MINKIKHYVRWKYDVIKHWPTVAKQLPEGGAIVEVGTWKGASAIRWLKRKPEYFISVDSYKVKDDSSWEGKATQKELDIISARAELHINLAKHFKTIVNFIKEDSLKAVETIDNESLDVVYIDGDHSFKACSADLRAWWPKVKPGGSIILDDHIPGRWWQYGVIDAAGFFYEKHIQERIEAGRWLIIKKCLNDKCYNCRNDKCNNREYECGCNHD